MSDNHDVFKACYLKSDGGGDTRKCGVVSAVDGQLIEIRGTEQCKTLAIFVVEFKPL